MNLTTHFELNEKVTKNNHVLNISTITMICNLNVEKIDLKSLYEFLVTVDKPINIKYSPNHKDYVVTKRGKIKKTFFNQLTINYKDVSNKSIKVFLNGKIQATGVVSISETKYIADMVCKWINKSITESSSDSKLVEPLEIKIGMINSNFSLKHAIDLNKFHALLLTTEHVFSRYEPESYPAINLKYSDNFSVSMFIFGSGNIVITGAKTINDIKQSYEFITNIIDENEHIKKVSVINIHKKKIDTSITNGYCSKQLMSFVK
jgi:TATA-box binding protein (TBP) (component of TFIID and TFIIIB)